MSVRHLPYTLLTIALMACGGATTESVAHEPAPEQKEHSHHTKHHRFVDAEAWSKKFDDPARDEWQKPDVVIEALDIKPGMTVVDIGAGTGYFEQRLDKAVGETGRVLALDVEPTLVDFMKKRGSKEKWKTVEVRQIPFDDPQLSDSSVDRILIVNTWHHIENRDGYAKKLLRALKAGGFVVVVDFNLQSPYGPPVSDRLTDEQIAGELVAAGFVAETALDSLPYQFVVNAGRSQQTAMQDGDQRPNGHVARAGIASTVPTIRNSDLSVRGGLDAEIVQRVVRRYGNDVRACYDREFGRTSPRSGMISIKIFVASRGEVVRTAVTGSTFGNARIEQCIARAARAWRFPSAEQSTVATLGYEIDSSGVTSMSP